MILDFKFLLIVLVISLIHLDSLRVGQFMIHRPIVVGPFVGMLLGIPQYGVLTGVVFELIFISLIPVGVKVPPDVTVSTVFALISYKYINECYILCIILGIIVGILYKHIDIFLRSVNCMVLNWVDNAKNEVLIKRINLLVIYGIITSYFQTVLFYLITFPVVDYIVKIICRFLHTGNIMQSIPLIHLLPAIGIGIGIAHFVER